MLTARTVLLLVMLLTFSTHHAAAYSKPVECCFKYAKRAVRNIESTYETPKECRLNAVVVVNANGDKICANPTASWVKKAMETRKKK